MRGEYTGDLVDGLRHGSGTLVFPNGDRYEGKFVKGFREGHGVFTSERGMRVYEGEWKRSLKHGKGVEKWLARNDRYEGEYQNDVFHGKGVLFRGISGSKYDGGFENGKKHGSGCMEFGMGMANGTNTGGTGMTKQQSPVSTMVSTLSLAASGTTNTTTNGKRHNRNAGATYDGQWSNGRMHGVGKYTRADGSFYDGAWIDGLSEGYGKEVCVDTGEIYEGNWRKGLRHGEGSITRLGRRRLGVWENGMRTKWTTAEMPVKIRTTVVGNSSPVADASKRKFAASTTTTVTKPTEFKRKNTTAVADAKPAPNNAQSKAP